MGENQRINKLLEKMTQFLKEIEKLRQSVSVEIPNQSEKTIAKEILEISHKWKKLSQISLLH
jgi:hypothetical protein